MTETIVITACILILVFIYIKNINKPVTKSDLQLTDIESKFKPFESEQDKCWSCGSIIENKHTGLNQGLCNSCTNDEKSN